MRPARGNACPRWIQAAAQSQRRRLRVPEAATARPGMTEDVPQDIPGLVPHAVPAVRRAGGGGASDQRSCPPATTSVRGIAKPGRIGESYLHHRVRGLHLDREPLSGPALLAWQ